MLSSCPMVGRVICQSGTRRHPSSNKVDIFCKPPRVRPEEIAVDNEGWATRHVVAQMKRTDRDKDWPIVQGLGQQLWERGQAIGLLHLTEFQSLTEAWLMASTQEKEQLSRRRPLLHALDASPPLEKIDFERLLSIERLIWERVNEHRQGNYTRAWKDFYRRWRGEDGWHWPTDEQWWLQHRHLMKAVHQHGLPPNPLAGIPSEELVSAALREVVKIAAATQNELARVLPPVDELLP